MRNIKQMEECAIAAPDGLVGEVKDYYFDDESFVIRYLVVTTGQWLSHRRVLVSPLSVARASWPEKALSLSITREQVRKGPDIDLEKPVSRQHERDYLRYYGYPFYWGGGGLWGMALSPDTMLAQPDFSRLDRGNPHLRSCNAIMRYYVHASDGDIGHVGSLIVDEQTWAIRYLVVKTSNWWLGHEVLVATSWISDIDWLDSKVSVELTREAIKHAPAYDPHEPLTRELESKIHVHHDRIGYWTREATHAGEDHAH